MPYIKSFAIVGYVLAASVLCPGCTVERLIRAGVLAPGARGMRAEDALDQGAEYVGIDREDEHSFDSDDFPKVVFADAVQDDTCEDCGGALL